MKIRILVYIIIIFSTGCQKFEEYKEDEPANFNSEEKIAYAMTGAYDRFRNIFIYYETDAFSGIKKLAWYTQPNSRGDEFSHFIMNYAYYEINNGQLQYNCSAQTTLYPLYKYYDVNDEWNDYYQTITSLNSIIAHAEKQGNLSQEVKKILGEAYFLRGYTYFRLVRVYGRVPLIKDCNVNYTVTRASFEEIYNSIEQDLKTAIDLLPANGSLARIPYVTPHAGTAKAVLAEVYLTRAGYPLKQNDYYAKAAEIAGYIIDSATYYGFEILPDFADLWKNRHEWNKEVILGINYNLFNYVYYRTMSYGPRDSNTYVFYIFEEGQPNYGTAIKFFNNYPNSYRKSATFYSLLLSPYNLDSLDNDKCRLYARDSMDLCTPFYFNKFNLIWKIDTNSIIDMNSDHRIDFKNNIDSYNESYYSFDLYLYRFAQTLLTFAEAKARSGQLDGKAFEALNIIRRRANKVDLYSPSKYDIVQNITPEQFADSVVWERAWELCAEPEGRWFDLVRLEKVEDLPNLRDVNDMENYPSVINKDYYFLPIPQSEIDLNPNLKLNDVFFH